MCLASSRSEPNAHFLQGSPREWRERSFPLRIPFDTGIRFADQNGFRMGLSSAFLPLFKAIDTVSEENADTSVDWASVDFVTDRNNLRKLLRWIHHSGAEYDAPLREFRIDLQLGGSKTVLMHRWEKRTQEMAEPPKSGCGLNFERENTLPAKGCERGTGHHRIVQYVSTSGIHSVSVTLQANGALDNIGA